MKDVTIPEPIQLVDLRTDELLKDEKDNPIEKMTFYKWFVTYVVGDTRTGGGGKAYGAVADLLIEFKKSQEPGTKVPVDDAFLQAIKPILTEKPPSRKIMCRQCGAGIDEGETTLFHLDPRISIQYRPFVKALLDPIGG